MKPINSLMIAIGLLMSLMSCSQEDANTTNEGGAVKVILSTEQQLGVKSSTTPTISGYHLRYILEVFEQDASGIAGNSVERIASVVPEFDLTKLEQGKKYILAGWADFVDSSTGITEVSDQAAFYNTSNLSNVQMQWSKWQLNNAALDAFCGTLSDFTNEQATTHITLKRPLALLNVKSKKNMEEYTQIKISSSEKVYTGYNLFSRDVVGSTQELSLIGTNLNTADSILAYTYLFARHLEDGRDYQSGTMTIPMAVDLYRSTTATTAESDFSHKTDFVPFSPNYRTNLYIAPETSTSTSVTLTPNANWEEKQIAGEKTFIVQSYLRPWQYLSGLTGANEINQVNDLIFFAVSPYANGELCFQTPENTATFHDVDFLDSFNGRNGVVSFKGTDTSYMNAGKSLIEEAKQNGSWTLGFTFSTWIYLEEWTPNAYIFEKASDGKEVSLKLGNTQGEFIITIGTFSGTLSSSNIELNKWQHLCLVHNTQGNATELWIAGNKDASVANNKIGAPTNQANMHIGKGIKGKIDETIIVGTNTGQWMVRNPLAQGNLSTLGEYSRARVEAHWKYDNTNNRGEDLRSWVTILNGMRAQLDNSKQRKIRLGVHGGDWQKMIASQESRTQFANSLKEVLEKYNLDGADLDFEWSYSTAEFNNYSATILKIREIIGPNYTFSVSLHPVSYKISMDAFDALDYINVQCYGPRVNRFAFTQYRDDAVVVTNYFKDKKKIILGVPFYGTHGNTAAGDPTTSYANLVTEGTPAVTKESTTTTYKGLTYTFDGYNMIQKKTRYALDKEYLGIMNWDLVTDLPFTHELSLLRATIEEVNKGAVQESPYRTDFD